MFRDFKFLRKGLTKNEEIENVPQNPRDLPPPSNGSTESAARAPLNAIQEAQQEHEAGYRSRVDRTPTKHKVGNKFGWSQASELPGATPRSMRNLVKGGSSSESNSTQTTPCKSVSKTLPPMSVRSKGDCRGAGFNPMYRGVPVSSGPCTTVVNLEKVPHFDLKEDPSFWMDHSVQVIIRVRPLNNMEKSMNGYSRCLKQESAHSIAWIGQPESRFTFDQVACETIDQETLFRMAGLPMVENCLSGYNSCMFAYGQTGSGKTYTMLGENEDLEVKPSVHRGMTPRIFEFLFARIQAEEESRRDEKLKYSCKCSFLEIYNEQITDLLEPSSTNLLLREDVKQGVYVENLSEFEVWSVSDILKLLMQGSSNRRVAATNMNRESSRSHCVFTCIIESKWEKESTTNLRFARLNLVDLAGSERQKTSGADGERLREAANINKSLSSLGHVIMVLVDVANGKPRHVPYRDSRLTFLLQDSLGGNSKTMIIANVSPSICCAAETLNTLKFAQRAKLIQNNAVVNEDSTGDVVTLQNQIRLLKEEISALKRQNVSRSLSFGSPASRDMMHEQENGCSSQKFVADQQHSEDFNSAEYKGIVRLSTKQLKSLETTLAGALRREQMAESSVNQLEAEIERLNRLVSQREEDTRRSKMMLKFREDKIHKMDNLLGGLMPVESYLVEENKRLSEEIQLLQAKIDRNPEVTRFALENIRLLDQLRRFQEFYEEGERDILITEVSNMRNQLLQFLDGSSAQTDNPSTVVKPEAATCISKQSDSLHFELESTLSELGECKKRLDSCVNENAKLSREIHELRAMFIHTKPAPCGVDGIPETTKDSLELPLKTARKNALQNKRLDGKTESLPLKHAEEIMNLQLELDILKIILTEEKSARNEVEERAKRLNEDLSLAKEKLTLTSKEFADLDAELKEAQTIIEVLESQQILAINEIEDLKTNNSCHVDLLNKKEELSRQEFRVQQHSNNLKGKDYPLQAKLTKMQASLEKAKRLNMWHQSYRDVDASNEKEMDEVRRQAEAETAEVIVCMQEELATLQQQVQEGHLKEMETQKIGILMETKLKELEEKLSLVNEENKQLRDNHEKNDAELKELSEEWELLTCELEQILANGHEELSDASDQLDFISSSFPQKRIWISDQVGQMIRIMSEKDLIIQDLTKCLEDADNRRTEIETMLKSLKGAALAITEAHQQECSEKESEISLLTSQLSVNKSSIAILEERLKFAEDEIEKISTCATVAFVIVNRYSEISLGHLDEIKHKDIQICDLNEAILTKDALLSDQSAVTIAAEEQIQLLRKELTDIENLCAELQLKLSEKEKRVSAMEQKLEDAQEDDFRKTREKVVELKTGVSTLRSCMNMFVEQHEKSTGKDFEHGSETSWNAPNELQTESEMSDQNKTDLQFIEGTRTGNSSCYPNEQNYLKSHQAFSKVCEGDVTITLLKKELEFGLESLKEVQAEMTKLRDEKEEISMSDKQSQESLKFLSMQLLSLQAYIVNFEQQCATKLEAFSHKLHIFEQKVEETVTSCYQTKELLNGEVGAAREAAVQKMAEASCILTNLEEAQKTRKEADMKIKDLMIANETLKLNAERLAAAEVMVRNERDTLITEVQDLQTINDSKSQKIVNLENQMESNFLESRDLVVELEDAVAEFQNAVIEQLMPLVTNFRKTNSLYVDSLQLVRSWLEKIWSEIIAKDCSLSVLHLCHIGVLLETLTGLNVENGLLQHGLCESSSIISDLREHNCKSRNELEKCRVLKGKLLGNIKSSFDRVSRNEETTGQLGLKLSDFEKKISDLQSQEELMLQRCNSMGSQLAVLMKELDSSNFNVMESLLDHNKLMKDKDNELKVQEELYTIELYSKDLQSFIFKSRLEEVYFQKSIFEKQCDIYCTVFENCKEEIILSHVDAELVKHIMVEKDFQIVLLDKEVEEAAKETQYLLSNLNKGKVTIEEIYTVNKALEEEIQTLRNLARSNDMLKGEVCDANAVKVNLLNQIQELEAEYEELKEDMEHKEASIESTSVYVAALDEQNKQLQRDICLLENSADGLQREIYIRNAELSNCCEFIENLKEEIILCNVDSRLKEDFLLGEEVEVSLLQNKIDEVEKERQVLLSQLKLSDSKIRHMAEVNQALERGNMLLKDVDSTNSTLRGELAAALEENKKMLNKVQSLDTEYKSLLLNFEIKQKALDFSSSQFSTLEQQNQKLQQDIQTLEASACRLQNEMEMKDVKLSNINSLEEENIKLQDQISDFESRIDSVQSEMLRKDGVIKGLSFDLRLLQESAANTTDQKDEIDRLRTTLQDLEDELGVKTCKLNEAISQCQTFEIQLQEKAFTLSALELNILEQCKTIESLSAENDELRAQADSLLDERKTMEVELSEERKTNENLEMEVSQMGDVIDQLNELVDFLKNNLEKLTAERDHLNREIHNLKDDIERVQAQAKANEENATEAHQLAESRVAFALEKEEEVKLLERSVEELECTVNVLENKVDLIKGEAERQRLQREDLELELHAVKHQLQTIKHSDADLKSQLDAKEKSLQEALRDMKALEMGIAEKGVEIGKLTAHIDELNLHAEAQASEYKQKFKELETMVEHVRLDIPSTQILNSSSNKSDKLPVRSRGSGSPFKCIGLGLTQQMKSERDEELTAAKQRIEELESVSVSRQKEIFSLNARLASAESMTHDVIRDLLGVKLDVTTYASMLDNQQVQRIAKKAQIHTPESQDQEVDKLKQQLSELIEQRKGLLEEIDRRQAELVATQISLEQLCQQDQLLKTEYEMLKAENISHKKKVMELEGEVKKLSGQQNLQQRIHHHAKIKEENNMLKLRIEDLNSKLHRNQLRLSSAREEINRYCAYIQELNS